MEISQQLRGQGSARASLPIDSVLDELVSALTSSSRAVLVAPPGAGKTTRVPGALADAFGGRVLLLEPRRVAARAAAQRMASELGERLGASVGLRMRGQTEVSAATRIEVVTEGVLARMLDTDPTLDGVSCVVFDEFHERSVDADVGLALTLDAHRQLRPDLRVLVMSATLDDERLVAVLGDGTPVIRSDVRQHAVQIEYRPLDLGVDPTNGAARAVVDVLAGIEGAHTVLVFLPGARELRRAQRSLERRGIASVLLHGGGGPDDHEQALRPLGKGEVRVVLATTIAQTSLTVPGVSTVVDSGLARTARVDHRTGLPRLETMPISHATATQRAGRAGRLGPGRCIRLWSLANHRLREPFDRPAILDADLCAIALTLASWGTPVEDLAFVDAPPPAVLEAARATLRRLGALDERDRITDHGRQLSATPTHPRLAHLLHTGARFGAESAKRAALVAAVLGVHEGEQTGRGSDLGRVVDELVDELRVSPAAARRRPTHQESDRLLRMAGAHLDNDNALDASTPLSVGALLALAYPDRVAVRQAESADRYVLGALVVTVAPDDELAGANLLVVADLDANRTSGRIWRAARVNEDDLVRVDPNALRVALSARWLPDPPVSTSELRIVEEVGWNDAVLRERARPPDRVAALELAEAAVRAHGLSALEIGTAAREHLDRLAFVRRVAAHLEWPASDETELGANAEWLSGWLPGPDLRLPLAQVDVGGALAARLSHDQRRALDEVAPTRLVLPSGTSVAVSYAHGRPEASARIQDLYGQRDTPKVGGVAVLFDLLSPANRSTARTDNLGRFWEVGYPHVRAELRGRYSKHDWPIDPGNAPPRRRRPSR